MNSVGWPSEPECSRPPSARRRVGTAVLTEDVELQLGCLLAHHILGDAGDLTAIVDRRQVTENQTGL